MVKQIAVVVSRFNEKITAELFAGCRTRLTEQGIILTDEAIAWVPGAVELPLIAQQFVHQGYAAVICLGAVIRGETSHYDYVCQQVSYGCQQLALSSNTPIIFGVLTTENTEQAYARVGGAKGHKGKEAADAALDMLRLMQRFA